MKLSDDSKVGNSVMPPAGTTTLQSCLDRFRAGDAAAGDELLARSQERLKLLTHSMLKRFPGVQRWEETDDVFQEVLLRLERMLRELVIQSVLDFIKLASHHIRLVLIDLARHYSGPLGLGSHYATPPTRMAESGGFAAIPAEDSVLAVDWAAVHAEVGRLPAEEREVFDLIWYYGASQSETARMLDVSLSTVQRRWQAARIRIAEVVTRDLSH